MNWFQNDWFASPQFTTEWWRTSDAPVPPVTELISGNHGRRFQFPTGANRVLQDDDEVIVFILSVLNSGMLH